MDGPKEAGIVVKAHEQDVVSQEISPDDISILQDAKTPGDLATRAPSAVGLPVKDVPDRRSSASVLGHNVTSRQSSVQDLPSWRLPTPSSTGQMIPSRGRSDSPVRKALQRDPVSSENLRRSPSKTLCGLPRHWISLMWVILGMEEWI